jgi:transcription initiation factor TFIIIB Brf1 subunit/transcription initiation factor TFIIB
VDIYSIGLKVDSRQVKTAQKDLGGMGRQAKSTGDSVKKFGANVDKSTRNVQGMNRGLDLAKKALGGFFAALSIRQLQAFTQASLEAAQTIDRQARSLGISAEEFQRISFAFRQFGADSSDISDAFNTLSDRAQDAKDGMQSFIDDFKLVGIEVDDLKGKEPGELFRLFAEGVSNVEDPTRRAAGVVRILGDDVGRRLLPMLMEGTEGLDALGKQANIASDEVIESSARIQTDLTQLVTELETGLQNAFLGATVRNEEAIRSLVATTLRGIGTIVQFADELAGPVGAGILGRVLVGKKTGAVLAAVTGTVQIVNTIINRLNESAGHELARIEEQIDDLVSSYEDNDMDIMNFPGAASDLKELKERRKELDDQVVDSIDLQSDYNDQLENNKDLGEDVAKAVFDAADAFEAGGASADKSAQSMSDFGKESADAAEKASDAADETQKEFTRVADTIESAFNDVFFNIFRNGEFSFQNLASSILDIYARMLAEMATQQIITPIIRPQMQGGGQAVGAGQGAGGGPVDLLGSVTQPGIGGQAATTFAKSGVGESLGLSRAMHPGMGQGQALTGTGSKLVGTASAATSLAGMGGNLVGTAIGGGTMEASMGATAGQVIGAAIGGPVGSFIGGAIGGAVGGALGDSDMDKAIAKQKESIEKRQDETIATIAQNTRLSESEKERRTAARRERELAGALSEGNRVRLEGLHALEEYADRLQEINRINDERNELERRYLNEIGDTAALRQLELDATESANRGILSFIFSLEDAAKKVQETESNAREAFRALQNTVRREQDAIEERLSGPIDALNSALDSLEGRTLTQRPRLARTQAQTSLRLAREEGVDTLSERNLERALDVVAEPSQQLFGSFTDYQRDFKQTETLVRELRDDAERQRDTQLGALQAQLDQGREQLNALFGINDSVLTVSQAMNNLGASISAAQSAQQSFASISAPENAPSFEERPTPPSTLRPGQTNDPLWESIVGRAYEEHIAAFGTDWFGSRTTNQERQAQLARMQNAYLDAKGFADGGMHEGGLRMVGERGPELEVTGPSRIYSNNDTRKMMGTDEMIDEIRSLREEVGELRREQGESQYQITRNTKRTRDTLEKFDIDGLPPERT